MGPCGSAGSGDRDSTWQVSPLLPPVLHYFSTPSQFNFPAFFSLILRCALLAAGIS